MVIGCEGGSCIRALDDIFEITGVTDHDWRALECVRANGIATSTMFKRTSPGDPEYGFWARSLKPREIIGNKSRRTIELKEGPQSSTGDATAIVQIFISSQGHRLMPESTRYLLKSATWTADLSSLLSITGYCWKVVQTSTQQVGVPSTKRRTFVACVRNHPSAEERLIRWRARLTNMRVQPVTLGEFIWLQRLIFLEQEAG